MRRVSNHERRRYLGRRRLVGVPTVGRGAMAAQPSAGVPGTLKPASFQPTPRHTATVSKRGAHGGYQTRSRHL